MAEEFLDVYNKNGGLIGKETKKEAHKQGLWHHSVHIWVYNSKGQVLIQKRSKDKDSYPSLWDISAAGHVSAGETIKGAAQREIYEELKLKIKGPELKDIGKDKVSNSIPNLNWYNNEFENIFLFKFDGNIKKFKLKKDETECIELISLEKFEKDVNNKQILKKYVPHKGRYYKYIIKKIKEELK